MVWRTGCLEFPPKIHEHFSQKLLRDFNKIIFAKYQKQKEKSGEKTDVLERTGN